MAQQAPLATRFRLFLSRFLTTPFLRRGVGESYQAHGLLLMTLLAAMVAAGLPLNVSALAPHQNTESRWHVLDLRRQPQGLPQNTVTAILQTSDGYIWVGTFGGLARFDGVRFTTFGERGRSRLKEREIQALAEGSDSSLWIGTFGAGLNRFQDGTFTTYTTKDGLVSEFVTSLCRDTRGTIWIGTQSGLSGFQDGRFTNFTTANGLATNSVSSLYCDNSGNVWIGQWEGKIQRFKDGVFDSITLEGFSGQISRAIFLDHDQVLWLGTNNGLFRWKDGKTSHYTTREGLSANRIPRLYEDREGNLWIGTINGLDLFRNGRITPIRMGDPVSSSNVTAISGDREGNLWIGSFNQGMVRAHQGEFLSYSTEQRLSGDHVTTVLGDDQDNLWIGTERGLNALVKGKIMAFPIPDIGAMAQDREGILWLGTGTGLYRTASRNQPLDRWKPQFVPVKYAPIPRLYVRGFLQDHQGTLWIATDVNGLLKYKDKQFTLYNTQDGLPDGHVRSLAEDQEGNLWVGTRGGLSLLKNGTFQTFTTKDGLAGNAVQVLYRDQENTLWIATREGLNRLKNGKFTTYTADNGLYCDFVSSLVEDNHGNLWMSCSKGVFRIAKQELNDFAEGKIKSVTSVAYGLEHGLGSTVATAGYSPGSCKTRDGKIWFAMAGALSVVDPEKLSRNTLPPPVHVEEADINQQSYALNQMANAPPGRGDLEFHYTALSFLAPEKVRFKYKLEGYDHDWTDAPDRRVAYYGKIPPGQYTFRVIAANNDLVWNQTGASFSFRLNPYLYQTLWFQILCGAILAIGLLQIIRLYHQRLKRREKELAVVEDALQRKTAAEARYRDLFESAVYGIYRARRGRYLEVNGAMVAMLGYHSRDEVLALDPATEVYADPADFARVQQALENTGKVEDLNVTWKRKDGKAIDVRLSGRRTPAMQGSADGDAAEIIAEDITDRKQLENRLQQAQKMDAVGRLAGGIAHDFNNLLTVILGYTRLVIDKIKEPEMRSSLREAEKAANHAAALTNQLLAFSRHQIVQPQALNLNAVVTSMKTMLERVIGEDIELSTELSADLGLMKGDRSQIEQIVMNLAVNARDAMPHGGKLRFSTHNIRVAEQGIQEQGKDVKPKLPPGDYVLLEVQDSGSGMPPETLAHIFEPFFTTKEAGHGTGLGLSTIYGIIQQSGGFVSVDSTVGKGTTFRIYLPRTQEPEVSAKPALLPVQQQPRGAETVLLIEDHAALRELTSTMLQSQGYTVLQASHPVEAERICREHRGCIDLILTDVVMPEISGPELARRLLKLRPAARLMYTSGYTENPALRQEVLNQNLPFLQKPFGRSDLLTKVREVLDTPISRMTA